MEYYFLSHCDVDGLCCHALADKVFSCRHFFVDYDTMKPNLEFVSYLRPGKVFVADIGASNLGVLHPFIKEIASKHCAEAWYDHHDWSGAFDILELFNKSVIDSSRCSARIFSDEHNLNDDVSESLARIAEASDFCKKSDEYYKYADKISACASYSKFKGLGFDSIVRILGAGDFDNFYLEDLSSSYYDEVVTAEDNLESDVKVFNVKGFSVYTGRCSPILYMRRGSEFLIDKFNADVAFTFFQSGQVLALMPEHNVKSIDLVGFCKSQSGGGRDNGGGFNTPLFTNFNDYENTIQTLTKKLEKFIKKPKK